jgi:hypothetical protein
VAGFYEHDDDATWGSINLGNALNGWKTCSFLRKNIGRS